MKKILEWEDLLDTDLEGFLQDMRDPDAEMEFFDLNGKRVDNGSHE